MHLNNNDNGNFSGFNRVALLSTVSRSNWNLEMLVFVKGGKPEYLEKNPRSKDENQQQTQPTYDAESGNPLEVFQSDIILTPSLIWLFKPLH